MDAGGMYSWGPHAARPFAERAGRAHHRPHPSDVEKLVAQLHGLVDAGNTVVVVEHDRHVIAGSDWVIDIGPGAGEEGGRVVAADPPAVVARAAKSRTALYLARELGEEWSGRRASE